MLESALKLSKGVAAQRFEVILFIGGFLLLLLSFFSLEAPASKYTLTYRTSPLWLPFSFGVGLIVLGVVLKLVDKESLLLGARRAVRIERVMHGYEAQVNRTKIRLEFGRIEESKSAERECAIILPANEYFDDQCIQDLRSSLGAFMNHEFSGRIEKIQHLVREHLADAKTTRAEKETGRFENSFGVGHCVYLNRPLDSNHRIVLVSVTTKRAGEGLRATFPGLLASVDHVQKVVRDNRVACLSMPLLGAGHGGLTPTEALFAIILALACGARDTGGHHLQKATIVVFQPNDKSDAEVPKRRAKHILRLALSLGC